MVRYSIGDIAKQSGFSASTIRYYERIGLLSVADRISGKRVYYTNTLDQLRAIRLAKMLGFNIAEMQILFNGFPHHTPASRRWQEIVPDKLVEIEQQIYDLQTMRDLLQSTHQCECKKLEDCAQSLSI